MDYRLPGITSLWNSKSEHFRTCKSYCESYGFRFGSTAAPELCKQPAELIFSDFCLCDLAAAKCTLYSNITNLGHSHLQDVQSKSLDTEEEKIRFDNNVPLEPKTKPNKKRWIENFDFNDKLGILKSVVDGLLKNNRSHAEISTKFIVLN